MKKVVIVGATSSIAEHCARIWAEAGNTHFVLLGRNDAKLQLIAHDLLVRHSTNSVKILTGNFLDPAEISNLADRSCSEGLPDIVLVAHGQLPVQADCQTDVTLCAEMLQINGLSPCLFAESFATRMADSSNATLAIIGSVAGDRGRRSNYVYGSAKGMIERYAQGLQHRFAGKGLRITLLKPGPTDTPMTAALKPTGTRLAPVHAVAQLLVKSIEQRKATAYVPSKWWLIMLVIRHLPRSVFNRLDI